MIKSSAPISQRSLGDTHISAVAVVRSWPWCEEIDQELRQLTDARQAVRTLGHVGDRPAVKVVIVEARQLAEERGAQRSRASDPAGPRSIGRDIQAKQPQQKQQKQERCAESLHRRSAKNPKMCSALRSSTSS